MYCTDCGSKMRQLEFLFSNPWHCDGCERGGGKAIEGDTWWTYVSLEHCTFVAGRAYQCPAQYLFDAHKDASSVEVPPGSTLVRVLSPVTVEWFSPEGAKIGTLDGESMVVEVVE